MKQRSRILAGVLALGLLTAAPVAAQTLDDALKLVPEDAAGFVVVNRLGKTAEQIENVTKRLGQVEQVELLKKLKEELGVRKGIQEEGTLFAVLFPPAGENGEPAGVVGVPVTDYQQFLQQLQPKDPQARITEVTLGEDRTMLAARKGSYALLAEPEHEAALKKVLEARRGITEAVQPLRQWLAENDLAAALTPRGLDAVLTQFRQGLEQARAGVANLPEGGEIVGAQIDSFDRFLQIAAKNVTHAGIGGKVDPAGNVVFSSRALFKEGGQFAKAGAKARTAEGGPLGGLPAGPYALAVGGSFSGELMKQMLDFSVQMMKMTSPDLTEEKAQQLSKAFRQMYEGLEAMSFRIGPGKAGQGVFGNAIGLMRVEDARRFLANYQETMKTVREVTKDLKTGPFAPPSYEVTQVRVAGQPALKVVTDVSKAGGDAGPGQQAMQWMFGPEGKVVTTLAAVDEHTIVMAYRPPEEFQEVLKAVKGKTQEFSEMPQVARTLDLLPRGSQAVLLINPKGVADLVNQLMDNQVLTFRPTPPVGAAMKVSAEGVEAELVIPAAVIETAGELYRKAQKGGAGAQDQ